MQVFFSYGHDTHKDFVHRLAAEIESLSNGEIKVWIDSYKIKRDSHWRDEITKGILKSQSVLAFLSKYSAREESVCRDELSIALVSKHGMIRTILLEAVPPKGDFTPSSRLTEYQWHDLSDYRSVQEQGEEAFSEYISAEAKQIIELLNGEDIKKYNDEVTRLRKAYHLPEHDDWTKFDNLIDNELIGRDWLFDKIKEWEKDTNGSKVMMLYGQPGAGKSMFCAHLQMRDPAVVAAFPCDCRYHQYSTTESIIINISYRLALRIKDYRTWVLAHLSDPSFDLSGDMLFNRLILQPLSTCNIDGDRSVMVIVVDALDEMQNDTLARFISDNAEALRPYVRFLITSRKTPDITERFNRYPCIDFDSEEQQGREDIEAYFKSKLGTVLAGYEGSEQFISKLIDHSHLMFTYAECVCNNILADIKDGCFNMQEYPVPNGIGELYKQTLDRSFGEERGRYSIEDFKHRWREPLGMILASPEPLPISTLKLLMDWQDDELNVFLHPLATLLTEAGGRLQVFHRSFGEWLNETKTEYKTSTDSGISALAEACYSVYKDAPEDMDDYMLLYTTKFLRESTKRSHRKAYEEVCEDVAYLKRISKNAEDLFIHCAFTASLLMFRELSENIKYLKERFPESPDCLREYSLSLYKVAGIYEAQKSLANALKLYQESLEIDKELIDIYPENPDYLCDYLVSLIKVADIYEEQNNFPNALKLCQESLEIAKELKDTYPKSLVYLYNYSVSLNRIAEIYEVQNSFPNALKLYQEALEIRKKIKDSYFDNPHYLHIYSESLNNVANIYKAQNALPNALKLYQEALEIWKELTDTYPKSPDYLHGYSVALNNVAGIYELLNDLTNALKLYQEALEIRKELKDTYPENSDYLRGYSVSLFFIATTYKAQNDILNAVKYYLKGLEILRKLVKQHPESQQYTDDLAETLWNIWQITDTEEYYNETVSIAKEHPDLPYCKEILGKIGQ